MKIDKVDEALILSAFEVIDSGESMDIELADGRAYKVKMLKPASPRLLINGMYIHIDARNIVMHEEDDYVEGEFWRDAAGLLHPVAWQADEKCWTIDLRGGRKVIRP